MKNTPNIKNKSPAGFRDGEATSRRQRRSNKYSSLPWGEGNTKTLLAKVLLFALLFLSSSLFAGEPQRHEFDSVQMGVPVRVVLYSENADVASEAAQKAFKTIERLNAVMSDYDSDSELSRLGAASNDIRIDNSIQAFDVPGPPRVGVRVSDDLFAVLRSAKHFGDISSGAFDVTVGPFTRLWRRAKRQRKLPEPFLLESAEQRVGNDFWELDGKEKMVWLKRHGMRFDLGGIAKGYAIDRAFEAITELGIETVLVDAGGDFRLGKAPPGGWQIMLGDEINGKTLTTLENIAMATSGDSQQFLLIDGVRYSHIIDPRTGLGLTESSTVHVLAPTATEADALASALSVLGPEKGIELIETLENTAAKIISQERCYRSKRWR